MDRVSEKQALRVLAHLATYGTPPNRETAKLLSVGLSGTLDRMGEEVLPHLSAGGSDILFVYGPNGRGKTHFLFEIEDLARQRNFITARVDCSHDSSPFESLRSTYELIAASMAISSENFASTKIGLHSVIENALHMHGPGGLETLAKRLKSSRYVAAEVRNLAIAYATTLNQSRSAEVLKNHLSSLLLGSRTVDVQLGELYKAYRELPRPLGRITRRNAAHWLRSLLSLPAALGYAGLVVMFDETEQRAGKIRLTELRSQLANIRNLVDYCALGALSGCLIIYAAADDFLERTRDNLDALAQRIEPPSLLGGSNPSSIRAAWADLDDLTTPRPEDAAFFIELAERVGELAKVAGVPQTHRDAVMKKLQGEAKRYSRSPKSGIVREFVKISALEFQSSRR